MMWIANLIYTCDKFIFSKYALVATVAVIMVMVVVVVVEVVVVVVE